MGKAFFDKKSFKQIPDGVLFKRVTAIGIIAAMGEVIEVDDTHPLCKPLAADKAKDKDNLDEFGLPTIVSRAIPEKTPEQESIALLNGAKRSLEYTQASFIKSLEDGAAPLSDGINDSRIAARDTCQSYLDETEEDYQASLIDPSSALPINVTLARMIATKGINLFNGAVG